jgi:hypothetical protein
MPGLVQSEPRPKPSAPRRAIRHAAGPTPPTACPGVAGQHGLERLHMSRSRRWRRERASGAARRVHRRRRPRWRCRSPGRGPCRRQHSADHGRVRCWGTPRSAARLGHGVRRVGDSTVPAPQTRRPSRRPAANAVQRSGEFSGTSTTRTPPACSASATRPPRRLHAADDGDDRGLRPARLRASSRSPVQGQQAGQHGVLAVADVLARRAGRARAGTSGRAAGRRSAGPAGPGSRPAGAGWRRLRPMSRPDR